MRNPVELSVAITAHREGALLIPTLQSVSAALVEYKSNRNTRAEILVILDNADEKTLDVVNTWKIDPRLGLNLTPIIASVGEAGAARNVAAQSAAGEFLCFCDGDDLISSNYLNEAINILERDETKKLILHPKHILSFGAVSSIWHVADVDDSDISADDLLEANLWPSSSVSRTTTYRDVPYKSLPPQQGFGPEDWLWNIQTTLSGYRHKPVPDTIFFYRTKSGSGVNSQHSSSILPQFDVSELLSILPVKKSNTENSSISDDRPFSEKILITSTKVALKAVKPISNILDQHFKDRVSRRFRKIGSFLVPQKSAPMETWSEGLEEFLKEACQLEPAISWPAFLADKLVEWLPRNRGYGELLRRTLAQIGKNPKRIVFAPWLGIGGADLVTENYLRAFTSEFGKESNVTFIATYDQQKTLPELIPPGVNFVQLPEAFLNFTPELQRRFIAQLIILAKPELTLSINCFHVTNALSEFHRQICASTSLYLSFFAFDQIGEGYPVNPISDFAERDFLNSISGIVTDNAATKTRLQSMFGLDASKIFVQLQPGFVVTPELNTETSAFQSQNFTSQNPFRILWPHRIDKEKRPDALVKIAQAAQKNQLPIQIDVYGQRVLTSDNDDLFKQFESVGIDFLGPYRGGLISLPTQDYDALLLTSENEGTPLVVVQSMLLSLPVIATSVGGLPQLLDEGKAGELVTHYTDIDGFLEAIKKLSESRDARQTIIRNAYNRAFALHSWKTFIEETVPKLK